jgi:hypothetical protein
VQVLLALGLGLALERLKPVPVIAAAIRRHAPRPPSVVTFNAEQPSLVYYLDAGPIGRLWSDQQVVAWSRDHHRGIIVTTRADLTRIRANAGALRLREIAAASGLDFSNGRRIELVALERVSNDLR